MDQEVQSYLNSHLPDRSSFIIEMEQFATKHRVPIMELSSLELLLQMIRVKQPKQILEIGTAIGYSAIRMAEVLPAARIVTIERDLNRYKQAEQFINRANRTNQISIVFGDALDLEAEIAKYRSFDVLFIDAAKSQYEKFFNIYEKYVNQGGLIITDNVLFRGLVHNGAGVTKRTKGIVKKLQSFVTYIVNHPNYDTVIVPIGDGVAISRKR